MGAPRIAQSQLLLLGSLAVIAVVAAFADGYNPYFLDIALSCGINVILAVSLNLINGFTGQFSLGHAGFMAIGAYSAAMLTTAGGPTLLPLAGGIPGVLFLFALLLGGVCAALVGLIVGVPSLRLKGDYLAIVTLGFGEIVRLLADNLSNITGGGRGLSQIAYPVVGESASKPNGVFSAGNTSQPLNSGTWWFWLSIVLIIIVLLVVGNLERSRVGRAWVAIREDEDAAEIMGVPTFKFKLWAFLIGASIGGLSGALYAGQVQFVVPSTFNVINSMLFLCAVVLGGQGNKLGVILGAFIIVYLPNFFLGRTELFGIPINGNDIANYKYLFFGLALVVLMIFRPQGLIPARQKLLTYGRSIYVATRRAALALAATPAPAPAAAEPSDTTEGGAR